MKKLFPPVIYDASIHEHRPMVPSSEAFDPSCLPISAFPGNTLKVNGDGLYQGVNSISPLVYIDGVVGVDQALPLDGSAATLKTLDYALGLLEAAQPGAVTLLLKAGQTFTLTRNHKLTNIDLRITYFDDPKYGLMDVPLGTSKICPQIMGDLTRPVLTAEQTLLPIGLWTCNGVELVNSTVTLVGLRVELPVLPDGLANIKLTHYSNHSDLFLCKDSKLSLEGCIVNKADVRSFAGLLGVCSRAKTTLAQYASQFCIEGVWADDHHMAKPVDFWTARNTFIKFLPDIPTDNTFASPYPLVPTAVESTDSCGLLTIFWLLSSSWHEPVANANSLQSFPLADATYGLRNYIYGMERDFQHRPINVQCSILL